MFKVTWPASANPWFHHFNVKIANYDVDLETAWSTVTTGNVGTITEYLQSTYAAATECFAIAVAEVDTCGNVGQYSVTKYSITPVPGGAPI